MDITLWPWAWPIAKEFEAQEVMQDKAHQVGHLGPNLRRQWLSLESVFEESLGQSYMSQGDDTRLAGKETHSRTLGSLTSGKGRGLRNAR